MTCIRGVTPFYIQLLGKTLRKTQVTIEFEGERADHVGG